jgi:hypothetical protein
LDCVQGFSVTHSHALSVTPFTVYVAAQQHEYVPHDGFV